MVQELIRQFGGRLEGDRPLDDAMTRAVREPVFLTEADLVDEDFDIPEGWQLKLTPSETGFTQSLITSEGEEVSFGDVVVDPETGAWITRSKLQIKTRQLQAPFVIPEEELAAETAQQQELLYGEMFTSLERLFPEELPQALLSDVPSLLDRIREAGRTPETEELLKRLSPFATQEEVEGFFAPSMQVSDESNRLFYDVFPKGLDVVAFMDLGQDKPEELLKLIWMRGDTEASRNLIKSLWPQITDEDITGLFTEAKQQFMPEPERPALSPLLIDALPKVVTVDTLDEMYDFFSDKPEVLRSNLITVGRNDDTEALVRELYPGITEQGIKDYFSSAARRVEREALRITETGEYGTFTAGVGGLVSNFGGMFKWLGADGIGEHLTKAGQFMQVRALPVEPETFSWEQLFNPNSYYVQGFIQALPSLMLLAVPAVGAYGLAGSVAAKLGLGAFKRAMLAGVGGALFTRPLESAMEGGSAYDAARAKGMSHDEAKDVANQVFLNNLKLAGLDATQIAFMFMPAPARVTASLIRKGLVNTVFVAGKLFYTGLSEGGEEVLQDIYLRQALGEEIKWDAEMQLVFAIGTFAGIAMGAGGDLVVRVQNRVIGDFSPEQKAQFDKGKAEYLTEGFSDDVSAQKALDDMAAQDEAIEQRIEEAAKQVEKEFTIEQITVEDAVDQAVVDNLKEKVLPEKTAVERFLAVPEGELAIPTEEIFDALRARGYSEEYVRSIDVTEMKQILRQPVPEAVREAIEPTPPAVERVSIKEREAFRVGTNLERNYQLLAGYGEKGVANIKQFSTTQLNDFRKLVSQGRAETWREEGLRWYRVKPPAAEVVPTAEPGRPEAGLQRGMFDRDIEFRPAGRGREVQISMDDAAKLQKVTKAAEEAPPETQQAYEAQATIEGLGAVHEVDPVAQARFKIGGKNVGLDSFISIREQTFPDYFTVKQAQALSPGKDFSNYLVQGTPQYNRVPRDVALDDLSKRFNMTPDEIADRVMGIRAEKRQIKDLQDDIEKVYTEKPLPALAEPSREEIEDSETTITQPRLTRKQVDALTGFFGEYLDDPSVMKAWELTREMRRETLGGRAQEMEARAQQLVADTGITMEAAIKQAMADTMSGELPTLETDYLQWATGELRDAMFAKVYYTLKKEPFELMSTVTALTNALNGRAIPREPGVKGGSAYSRLQRVFGKQPKLLKGIDTMAKEGEKLEDIVEGVFHETGRAPVPIDQATADYLRNLSTIPVGQAYFRKDYDSLKALTDSKSEEQIHKETEELKIELASPPKPPIRYEPPIEEAFKEIPLWPVPARDRVVKVLKEIGMSPVDIGNFLRANKASFDFSFWRQQAPLIAGSPVDFAMANVDAWNALWSEKAAEAAWVAIMKDKTGLYQIYELAAEEGGDFLRPRHIPKGTSQYKGTEEFGYTKGVERWIPKLTTKLPWVRISQRSFETGTNSHNWRIFQGYYQSMQRLSEQYATGQKTMKPGEVFDITKEMIDFSKMLANFSARGSLGRFAAAAPQLSGLFFAPRAAVGRILSAKDLLNANPRVRREAWKNASLFVSTFGGLILLGAYAGWWDVEKDPRSAEYMSIRIGNTRIDPWGGVRQFLVFFTRAITQTGVSSVTGAEYKADPLSLLQTFIRGKASPLASLFLDFWRGKNFIGEEVDIANKRQWLERIAPFSVWDIYEAYIDDPIHALQSFLPAMLGAGVQTYTGEWPENFMKLGLTKYSENLDYGLNEPVYDVRDFWADTSSRFAGVDPETLTEAKGYPAYIKAIAEARLVKEQLESYPNDKIHNLNPVYHRMWIDRQAIVASGDEVRLEEFDKHERTTNAHLGNYSQKVFASLVEYNSIVDEAKRKEYLEAHPELSVNPRQEWLKNHPQENALLAVWGQADVLTQAAYDETLRLANEFGIPDSALAEYLPPAGVAQAYFEYEELITEFSANAWEAQLLGAENPELFEWLGRQPVLVPIEALELKVKNRATSEEFDLLETDEDKATFKAEHTDWVDDMRRVDAWEHDGEDWVEKWVERGHIIDEFGANSSEAKVWLLDNSDVHTWALAQELLTDEGEDWNEPVLRINEHWATQDDEYDALETSEAREAYLANNEAYRQDRRRRQAYRAEGPAGETFSQAQIEQYVSYYELPVRGFRQERYLLKNPDFAAAIHTINGMDLPDPSKIPSVRYDEIYEANKDSFDKFWGLADFKSEHYVENKAAREGQRLQMRYVTKTVRYFDDDGLQVREEQIIGLTEFGKQLRQLEAYSKFFSESNIQNYVDYYTILDIGRPREQTEWYDDDWFLMENPEFYQEARSLLGWSRRDFKKVPTREVFALYLEYQNIDTSQGKLNFRHKHKDLEAWLVAWKGYTPVGDRWTAIPTAEDPNIAERKYWLDQARHYKDLLKNLGIRLDITPEELTDAQALQIQREIERLRGG